MADTAFVTTVLVAVAIVAALVDWWAVANHRRGVEYLAKPAVMIALIGVALAVDTTDGVARGLIVAALGASLVGDVVLMTPDGRFEAGLGAFLVAHALYLVAFLPYTLTVPTVVGAVVIAAAAAVLAPRIVRAAAARSRLLGAAVPVYVVFVSATAVVAIGTGEPVAAVGGVLFLISDALLGWNRFVDEIPHGKLAVHATYHVGQMGLVAWLTTI